MEWLVLMAGLLLAFVNGANDNFKGVATLYGSGALSYRQALTLATVSTLLGSLLSLALASGLIHAFSGKGIIPAELLEAPLLASVALAATITVLLATRLGFPISTTHALVGGIAGGGIVAAGGALEFFVLARAFALPLLVGPLLAVALAYVGLRLARRASGALSLESASCVCLAQTQVGSACPVHPLEAVAFAGPSALEEYRTRSRFRVNTGIEPACQDESADRVVAVSVEGALTLGHLLSAGLVGFARGLNDTPKIVGLVVGVGIVSMAQGTVAIALMMMAGGLISARRVAEKLSHEITPMTTSQGLVGNLATSGLVIAASRYGLPVSTTHVSTGAIFGIGGEEGSLNRRTLVQILSAWIVTLPIAAGISAGLMWWGPWM
jgi:PiT family inorganic phosphate transporter